MNYCIYTLHLLSFMLSSWQIQLRVCRSWTARNYARVTLQPWRIQLLVCRFLSSSLLAHTPAIVQIIIRSIYADCVDSDSQLPTTNGWTFFFWNFWATSFHKMLCKMLRGWLDPYLNWNTEFCTKLTHFSQSSLVVRATTANINVHPWSLQLGFLKMDRAMKNQGDEQICVLPGKT